MPSHRRILRTSIACALVVASVAGCRTGKRGVRVGSESASVRVNMIGIDPSFDKDASLVFELTGCTATTTGKRDGETSVVTFTGTGIKRQAICQIKVRTIEANPPGITFTAEPSLVYWARELLVVEDTIGQLVGTARLQPVFQRNVPREPGKSFAVVAPVTFTPQAGEKMINATLDCAPQLPNVGVWKPGTTGNGMFEFVAEIGAEKNYQCARIWVSADGVGQKYRGVYSAAAKFEAAADLRFELPPVALELQQPPPSVPPREDTGVAVSTKPGSCAADEIYNIATRKCEKKP